MSDSQREDGSVKGFEPPGARIWEMVEHIHASSNRVSLVTTGGGSRAVSWLLNHPGASRVMLEAHIPYHHIALERFLGSAGPHKVVAETARSMALLVYERACALLADIESEVSSSEARALAVSCTAALETDRQRHGGDRAHVALRTPQQYEVVSIEFDRGGGGDRTTQEEVVSTIIVQTLAACCGVRSEQPLELPSWVQVRAETLAVEPLLEKFLRGDAAAMQFDLVGRQLEGPVERRALLCGSFNPLHSGHEELAAAAGRITGLQSGLELSIINVDKAQLGYRELTERVIPLRGRFPVAITRAPTFQEKSRLFPGSWFVIGYDTARRLLQPKYYGGSAETMVQALQEIGASGCRFLVAGRLHDGVFATLDDLVIPQGVDSGVLQALPESEFRSDASSTQIRTSAGVEAS